MDSFVNLWQRFCGINTSLRWQYMPSRVFVLNRFVHQRLISQGCTASRISIIRNNPILSSSSSILSGFSRKSKYKSYHDLCISSHTKIISFISETGLDDHEDWDWDNYSCRVDSHINGIMNVLLRIVSHLNSLNIRIVILLKEHPTDVNDYANRMLSSLPSSNYRIVSDLSPSFMFSESNAIVGVGSMLLHEASFYNSNTFSLKLTDINQYPFSHYTQSLHECNSTEKLYNQLIPILLT